MATKPVFGVNDAVPTDRAPADRGRAALDTLVRAHREPVARLAGRLLGWSPDVEEVVQEVFVSALTAMGGFRGRSSIETWLSRITINKCR
ncbi:MAG: sigma factor, partial [Planctomycetota bacterium]|nr:sigma factor [Planctomycetota bacterium]